MSVLTDSPASGAKIAMPARPATALVAAGFGDYEAAVGIANKDPRRGAAHESSREAGHRDSRGDAARALVQTIERQVSIAAPLGAIPRAV
jgi:hypothetical protein